MNTTLDWLSKKQNKKLSNILKNRAVNLKTPVFKQQSSASTNNSLIKKLTQREYQIFTLIGNVLSSQEIANLLNISKETVSTHRKNIIKKLELRGTRMLQNVAFININT